MRIQGWPDKTALCPRLFTIALLSVAAFLGGVQNSSATFDTLNISASPTNGTSPLTVTFTAATTSSTGLPVSSWNWTFFTNTTPSIGTASGRVVSFTFTNPGNYSAIISYSPHGNPGIGNPATLYITASNSSSPAPVKILSPQISAGNFNFSFQTTNNQSYTVQTSTNLLTTNWSFVTNFTGRGGLTNVVAPLGTNRQFFRVREP
jgi:PKD repeat protein